MQLHHEIAGSGDTIVLIHAGIADSRMWAPQWRRYAEDTSGALRHARVRAVAAAAGALPARQDLLDLLDRLEIERAALVGNSLGGRVALEATLARPQLVTALVLVGPGLPNAGWSDEVVAYGSEEVRLFMDGELDAAADLTVRFWVGGVGREPDEVDADLRRLVYDMQLRAYQHAQEGGDAARGAGAGRGRRRPRRRGAGAHPAGRRRPRPARHPSHRRAPQP